MPACTIDSCETPAHARGMCPSHWAKDRRARHPEKHAEDLAKRKARKAAHAASNPTLLCVVCKDPLLNYMPGRMGVRPAHKACRETAPSYLLNGTPGPMQARALRLLEVAARGTTGAVSWTTGPCPWCDETFTRQGATWCSRQCKDAAKQARRGHFVVRPARRKALMDRDGWTCQLCQLPIDPTLHYLDAWSATLDHIVPVSTVLVPDHSDANLRAAHRWCNSARGDGWQVPGDEVTSRAHLQLSSKSSDTLIHMQ